MQPTDNSNKKKIALVLVVIGIAAFLINPAIGFFVIYIAIILLTKKKNNSKPNLFTLLNDLSRSNSQSQDPSTSDSISQPKPLSTPGREQEPEFGTVDDLLGRVQDANIFINTPLVSAKASRLQRRKKYLDRKSTRLNSSH